MVTYLLRMMTSWAIVCSVWYLPPMTRQVSQLSLPYPIHCRAALFFCCMVSFSHSLKRTLSSLPIE